MNSLGSYLLANSYSAISPAFNTASAVCSVNGESVPCNSGIFQGIFLIVGSFWIFGLALALLVIVSNWKIYKKAGHPGWASIIPIYNMVVLLNIVKKPTWWVILYFIPLVNVIIGFIVLYKLAKAFGKDTGFFFGLLFLPFIFFPILAFSKKAVYLFKTDTSETVNTNSETTFPSQSIN